MSSLGVKKGGRNHAVYQRWQVGSGVYTVGYKNHEEGRLCMNSNILLSVFNSCSGYLFRVLLLIEPRIFESLVFWMKAWLFGNT